MLKAVPANVEIEFLKTDTQGYDLDVVKSAGEGIRRVGRIMTETYLRGIEERRYEGVRNDLVRDWVPYMREMGYTLQNPPDYEGDEYDAIWVREKGWGRK